MPSTSSEAVRDAIRVWKVTGVGLPIRGSVTDWTYVAVACAAARMAR